MGEMFRMGGDRGGVMGKRKVTFQIWDEQFWWGHRSRR